MHGYLSETIIHVNAQQHTKNIQINTQHKKITVHCTHLFFV